MDPAVLIFLLYVMIAHELVCGWMERRRHATKPRTPGGPTWSSSNIHSYQRPSRVTFRPVRSDKGQDWRKRARIVRKA